MQPSNSSHPSLAQLRQAVLALAVLDDVDVSPRDSGVDLAAGGHLSWPDVASALGPWVSQPAHPVARRRLRLAAAVVGVTALGGPDALLAACHAHAEPVTTTTGAAATATATATATTPGQGTGTGTAAAAAAATATATAAAAMAPGPGWVRERVGGGAIALGLGVSDLAGVAGPHPLPLLPSLLLALADRLDARWAEAREDLERLGGLVVARLDRDLAEGRPLVLRPTGSADVVTLLGSRQLRGWLAGGDGTGMRAVAVPVRDRGWFDLARIDPAYVRAAWSASDPLVRAFDRPLLVTVDEVCAPVPSGDVLAGVLADPAGRSLERHLRRR